jgi:beta-glucanase (GH16 family)
LGLQAITKEGITMRITRICSFAAIGTAWVSASGNCALQAQTLSTAGWTQTWSDEFNNGSSDLSGLSYTLGNPDGAPEMETYTNSTQNVFVGPATDASAAGGTVGALHIDTIYNGNGTYTSGFVSTYKTFSQKYGLFEIRAKLPQGAGLWPAFWMMPTAPAGSNTPLYGVWPNSGEIDIMEAGYDGNSNNVEAHLHSGPSSSQTQPGGSFKPSGSEVPFSTADWHTYSVEWEPGSISFFVDDQEYESMTANSVTTYLNGVGTTEDEPGWAIPANAPAGDTMAPFDQPFHLIFNVAVGDYAGTPDLTPNVPYDMSIDYARAYELSAPEPGAMAVIAVVGIGVLRRRR